jgi:hypothetical protein
VKRLDLPVFFKESRSRQSWSSNSDGDDKDSGVEKISKKTEKINPVINFGKVIECQLAVSSRLRRGKVLEFIYSTGSAFLLMAAINHERPITTV